jgi:hypothetical protein
MRISLHRTNRPMALRCVWIQVKTDGRTHLAAVWLDETARAERSSEVESSASHDDPPAVAA